MNLNDYLGTNALRLELSEKMLTGLHAVIKKLSDGDASMVMKLIDAAEHSSWNEGYDEGYRDAQEEEAV